MAFDLNALVPEGWEVVGYRSPKAGEGYLGVITEDTNRGRGMLGAMTARCALHAPAIILKRKRWRAKLGARYFLIWPEGNVSHSREDGVPTDDNHYELGNYFETEVEAEAVAEKIRAVFKAGRGGEKGPPDQPEMEKKLQKLLRRHRAHVFDVGSGDRHSRAVERLKRTKTFKAMCRRREDEARARAGERLTRQGY